MAKASLASFTERMDEGRALAMERRNRGLHTGRSAAGWGRKRPAPTGWDRLQWEYDTWRAEWQYACLAAVETELFAAEWAEWEGL